MTAGYTPKIDPTSAFAENLINGLAHLGKLVGEVNVSNGWDTSRGMIANPGAYDPKWQVAHKIAELGLVDTEVSEAIEEIRHGRGMNELYYSGGFDMGTTPSQEREPIDRAGYPRKPEGVPSELADVLIRVLDIADAYRIDLGEAVVQKLNHNATRGMHHGGKAL